MIKYTTGFVDKLEDILEESKYTVRYERGNFQSGWCLLDHKRVVVLNKFLNTEGRVNTLVDLIPQLKIDYDKLTLSSQKLYEFLTANRLEQLGGKIEEAENVDNADNSADSASATQEQAQMNADADVDPDENGATDVDADSETSTAAQEAEGSGDEEGREGENENDKEKQA